MAANDSKTSPGAPPEPMPAVVSLRPSDDAMRLEVVFQKSGENTIPPSLMDVKALLEEAGVVYGVDEGLLAALCSRPVYFRPFIVAKGKPPGEGKDGSLTYLVETVRELRPKLRENGTADYRDLGFIQNVSKGQVLCEIHPPEKGEDGWDIYGNLKEGKVGAPAKNPQGKNTLVSEDGAALLAGVDGTVDVHRGIVNIQDVLRVDGNVDNATGDIHFVGDVIVSGDVVSGFVVETTNGSITVRGSVEGATLRASGDIVVGEGINGMNRGSITAGGIVKCKYIQSCYIQSGSDIYADSIMYCNLECGGNLELSGKRAALIGGRSAIAGKLIAKTIGTESHVTTHITMASSGMEKDQEIHALTAEIRTIDEDTRKHLQLMARYDELLKHGKLGGKQKSIVLSVQESYVKLVERRKQTVLDLEEAKREQLDAGRENSYIECKGRVHVGVQIVFGPLILSVQNSFVNSRVSVVDHDITVRTL